MGPEKGIDDSLLSPGFYSCPTKERAEVRVECVKHAQVRPMGAAPPEAVEGETGSVRPVVETSVGNTVGSRLRAGATASNHGPKDITCIAISGPLKWLFK